jgi:drug/metabolite transporter (DMT)-like permease
VSGRDPRAYAALVALALVWGCNWVVLKVATVDATPFALTALRTLLGALALFALLGLTRRSFRSPPVVPTAILGLLNTAGFFIFQTLAVATGGAGKSAILAYTYPFWIALLAWPLLGDRVTRTSVIGLVLAAAGLAFILMPIDFSHGLASKFFAVMTAVDWAFASIYAKRMRAKYDADLLSLTAWQTLYGAIPLVIVALAVPHQYVHLTVSFGWAIAYIAIFGTALGLLLWLYALNRLQAGAAALASLMTPVITVFIAWLALHEQPSLSELTGIVLILSALSVDALPALIGRRARSA